MSHWDEDCKWYWKKEIEAVLSTPAGCSLCVCAEEWVSLLTEHWLAQVVLEGFSCMGLF